MTKHLPAEVVDVIHRVWAGRLGVSPHVFEVSGPVFKDWKAVPAAVVLRLDGTTVIAAPERALAALRGLDRQQLLDPMTLMAALEHEGPQLVGKARLSFIDREAFSPDRTVTPREAALADVESVLSACSIEERDESGLGEMDALWVADQPAGEPVAAAGYEIWGEGIAHIGLAVAPGARGQGLGAGVATAAVDHALSVGLVPQWRSAMENAASESVGRRLGFVPLGEQTAVDLTV